MGQYVDINALEGNFKEIYADKIENLVPEFAKCMRMIGFKERDRIGDGFHQPVVLTQEQGFTYAAANSSAFALNTSVAHQMKDAVVDGSQVLIRAQIDYESAAKASGSRQAFTRVTEQVVRNTMESHSKHRELSLIYGQKGFASTSVSSNVSATTTTITITTASWATGTWSGLENAKINFYNATSGTQVSSGTDGDFTVTTVDVTNKQVLVTGTSTGITALDAALAASTTEFDIYFKGQKSNDAAGLYKIITNSGSLFGINAATYNLWTGSTYSVGGQLTPAKFFKAVALAIGRGLTTKATCLLNPDAWSDLMQQLATNQRYDGSYKRTKGEYGFEGIELVTANGGVTVYPHGFVKIGDGFIFPENRCKRIGATDITFKNPGTGDRFFRELSDNAGYELRSYDHQALFIEKPAETVYLSGITVS